MKILRYNLIILMALAAVACSKSPEEQTVEKVFEMRKADDYSQLKPLVHPVALERDPFSAWNRVVSAPTGMFGKYKSHTLEKKSEDNRGDYTIKDLFYTVQYENRTVYERFFLRDEGSDFLLVEYRYNTDKNEIMED